MAQESGADLIDEDEQEPARKKRTMEKSASPESTSIDPGEDFTLLNILSAIEKVTNWKELGTQLGVTSAKMNLIEADEPTEVDRKRKMIQVWMELNEASWRLLISALLSPAVCEKTVVRELEKRQGSSFDSKSVLLCQSLGTSENSEEEFNEANVRNAIEVIPYNRELGNKLGIPLGKLSEIDMLAPDKQKQKLVEILFKVDPDCNWTRLRAAMNAVDVLEWAKRSMLRSGSLQKSNSDSFSESFLSPAHLDVSSDALSMSDDCEQLAAKVVTRKNTAMIKTNYSKLIMKITRNLTKVDPDMSSFYQFVINLLDVEDLPKAESVKDIFEILTKRKYWKFTDVDYLESIVELFSEDLEDLNMKMIKEYKEDLAGFKIATKIADFVNSDKQNGEEYISIMADVTKYDEKYRKKLAIQLDGSKGKLGVKISLKSLQYIENLWNSLCDEFMMPSLPNLLDSIVAGSIIVTWLIRRIHARKILDRIGCTVEFLRNEFIVGVFLEDICIYDEDSGVANVEILNYMKLLMVEQEGNVDKMNSILQLFFPNINIAISKEGRSLLMFAAEQGRKTMLEFLLDHGADPFQRDSIGGDVLRLSMPHSDVHCWIKNKLEEKLITAAQDGIKSNMERALEFGVDPNAKEKDEYRWTSLLWACENNHGEIVDSLLEHGADANAEDSSNWTGLILASRKGDIGIVKKLLDNGADLNKATNAHWTALMWTAQENHADVTKLLLERGAKTTLHDKEGFSPLIQASQDGNIDVVKVLLEHDTELDISYTTKTDWSALAVATKNGHDDIIRTLVDHGANVNYQKMDGITILHIASYKGHEKIARYLCVQERVDVNVQDMDGITPLIFSAKQGQFNLVRLLVENGRANLNISESTNEWTAVFFAMQARQQEVMEYLLRTGRVNLKHKDVEGNTLFDLSEKINKTAYEYLKEHHKADMEEHLVKKSKEATMAKPTTKLGKLEGEYYQPMLDRMQSRMNSDPHITAGAA